MNILKWAGKALLRLLGAICSILVAATAMAFGKFYPLPTFIVIAVLALGVVAWWALRRRRKTEGSGGLGEG